MSRLLEVFLWVLVGVLFLLVTRPADAQLFRRSYSFGKCGDAACAMCYPRGVTIRQSPKASVVSSIPIANKPELAPSPMPVVYEMLRQLRLTPDDTLYDLGSGDGRVIVAAAQTYGCRAVGIEIDKQQVALARKRIAEANIDNCWVIEADVTKYPLHGATAATIYLSPALTNAVALRVHTSRVASYMHPLPIASRTVPVDGGIIYVGVGDVSYAIE